MKSEQLIAFFNSYEQGSKDSLLIVRKQQENVIKYFKSLTAFEGQQAELMSHIARDYILDEIMLKAIAEPRKELSKYALQSLNFSKTSNLLNNKSIRLADMFTLLPSPTLILLLLYIA